MDDKYIEDALERGSIRPKTGHLWCEKLHHRGEFFTLGDRGMVEGERRASGLIIPSTKSIESLSVLAKTYVVRARGPTPHSWSFRFFDKERDYKTTWDEQKIEVGTVVAARAVAGVDQDKTSKFIELRYDELCLIGGSLSDGEDLPNFFPAPGWVCIRPLLSGRKDSLHINEDINEVLTYGHVVRGEVYSLPRGIDSDLNIGDIVFAPLHSGNGATEWVEVEGYRILPLDDILGVEEK